MVEEDATITFFKFSKNSGSYSSSHDEHSPAISLSRHGHCYREMAKQSPLNYGATATHLMGTSLSSVPLSHIVQPNIEPLRDSDLANSVLRNRISEVNLILASDCLIRRFNLSTLLDSNQFLCDTVLSGRQTTTTAQ